MNFNTPNYALVSSNKNKIAEFQRFGLNCSVAQGLDLREVESSALDVIIYKALEAGVNKIVEDTSLNIEGFEDFGVDIRWQLNGLGKAEGAKAEWVVMIAVNDNEYIHVFEGKVNGTIKTPEVIDENAFGFDPFFVPNDSDESLTDLERKGEKDHFSARKRAVDSLISGTPVKSLKISDIPEWTGDWQH